MRVSPGLMTFLVGLILLAMVGVAYQHSLIKQGKVGGGAAPAASAQALAGKPVLYTCPMHPQIIRDHPGTCPICGMELVLKDTSGGTVDQATSELIHDVKLSPLQAVLADVQTVAPERRAMSITVSAIGEVKPAEGRTRDIVSWLDGRVDHLVVRESGGVIREGEHILDIYSPDLVQAEEEYLLALKAAGQFSGSAYADIGQTSQRLADASKLKLTRLGMTEEQVSQLAQTGKTLEDVPIYAGYGGTVMDKMVTEGMYVMRGEKLYTLVDLSSVWVELQVFERDVANLKVGDHVTLDCPIHPGMTFRGQITLLEPELNMETRTITARVLVRNQDDILKPGLILDAKMTVDFGKPLLLPRDAVLHTGDGDLVYVLARENVWEPRKVTTGHDFGDMVEITAGVSEEDDVAATAVFLLDSEAQLKGVPRPIDTALETGTAGTSGTHSGH